MSLTRRTRVLRWREGTSEESSDDLATEEPLEIRLSGEPWSVTMRTPGNDVELAAGLVFSEGLTDGPPLVRSEGPNIVNVAGVQPAHARATVTSASCGLCGKRSIESVQQHFPPLEDDVTFSPPGLQRMLAALETSQPAFAKSGGIHAAGLFDTGGALIAIREDIGRHNAVDKLIGNALLLHRMPLKGHVLLVSGRTSFEIVQKALAARIPVIAGVSAPSSLAVDFAEANGQTLVGFLRPGRCNVYSHPERLTAL